MTLVSKDGIVPDSAVAAPHAVFELVDACLLASGADVWAMMLGWTADTSPIAEFKGRPQSFPLMAVNGCVGFAGQMTGAILFSCSDDMAKQMTEAILGSDHAIGPRDVFDIVGELTSILTGGCLARLRDKGFVLTMSIPSIICGQSIHSTSKDVTFLIQRRFIVTGQTATGEVQVTIAWKL
jgi:CheY-specific phosphatase CheX